MFVLGRDAHHNDAGRLLRSLYDHVLTFAWIASEPGEHRVAAWRKHDLELRIRADNETTRAGQAMLEAPTRAQMERDIASIAGVLPDTASMAFAADRHWAPSINIIDRGGLRSFLGLYTVVFRQYSGLVHASYRGLNYTVEDLGAQRHRVVVQAPVVGRGPYGPATAIFGLGLYVAVQAMGWPSAREIDDVFEQYPAG